MIHLKGIPLKSTGTGLRRVLQASGAAKRHVSDWNMMAEAFLDPSQSKPIRRNQSSTATSTTTAAGAAKKATPLKSATASSTSRAAAAPASSVPAAEPAAPESKEVTGTISDFATTVLSDSPLGSQIAQSSAINWSDSFHGLGSESFNDKIQEILAEPIDSEDIEITPDGLLYLPEIKYRRVLNRAFGAGGWGLAPRSETMVQKNGLGGTVTREYALICQGRLIGIARGEQDFFSDKGIPTASEGCKSNALMRCCKDLGIASELWDPKFIRKFKKANCEEVFVEHVVNKRKKKIWKRKDGFVEYPFKKT